MAKGNKLTVERAIKIGLAAWAAASAVAAYRFKKAGGTLNTEAIATLAVNPLAAFRVALSGPSAADLDQTGQSTTAIL